MLTNENYFLAVVGVGIKFLSHLTHEAKVHIEQADKVLYLVNDSATKQWLQQNNSSAESLDFLYTKFPRRQDNYDAITAYILESVSKYKNVCVVLYGHPCVFASPALEAVRQAKHLGYDASVLPAVSAEDCLFADLLVDPGDVGCQSFETTDFLIYQRQFDMGCHVILWQVGVIGALGLTDNFDNSKNIKILVEYLLKFYPAEHEVTLYEAAQLPGFEAKISAHRIHDLAKAAYSAITTLYIPPVIKKQYCSAIYQQLNLTNS